MDIGQYSAAEAANARSVPAAALASPKQVTKQLVAQPSALKESNIALVPGGGFRRMNREPPKQVIICR